MVNQNEEWVSIHATQKVVADDVILTTENQMGTFSINRKDIRENGGQLELRVGANVKILQAPPDSEGSEREKMANPNKDISIACVGAIPSQHVIGVMINCDTGKIIGKCMTSFPCT